MPTTSQRLAVAFALTFVVGVAAGFLAGGGPGSAAPPKPTRDASQPPPHPQAQAGAESDGEPDRGPESSTEAPCTPAEIAARIQAAAQTRDYFRRRHDIYAVGQLLDRDTIRMAMDALDQFSEADRDTAEYPLVARWLELDPAGAYTWVSALPERKRRTELMREFFHSLGLKDPRTALSFLAQYQADPNRGEDFTESVFEAWSAHDPGAAADAAFRLQTKDARESALEETLDRWAKSDPQAALARVAQLQDDERGSHMRRVLRAWAEEDPAAAANHAMSLAAGKERNEAISGVLRGAAAKDIDLGMRLIDQLPAGTARNEAIRNVINEFGSEEPKAMAELILALSPGQQYQEVHQVASSFGRQDREAALEWAGRLTGADARQAAMQSIVQQWASDDQKAAAEYCASNPNGTSQMLGSAVEGWARKDAAGALVWARSLSDGPQRNAALLSTIGALADSDPKQAANLATTMLGGENQSEALSRVASAWAEKDPVASAAWAMKLSDENTRVSAIGDVASVWVRQDPAAAAAWASSLPEKSYVLSTIAREWGTLDSAAAARWLDTLPSGNARDMAVINFSQAVANADPEAAAVWAATISKPDDRDNAIGNVYHQWKRTDPKAANAWLRATPALSKPMRAQMLESGD